MTNKRSTKRALIASAVSLLLCFTMLLGTTYAWFTDSVESTNNIIKSGNLDIVLEYYDAELKDWVEVDDKTNVFTDELWEPGHTEVVYLRVTNAGSLALKYNLGVNVDSETPGVNVAGDTFMLSDYIMFGVDDDMTPSYADRDAAIEAVKDNAKIISKGYAKSNALAPKENNVDSLALVVYMPETVGNDANYKTGTNPPVINLGINLFATQTEYEEDSFGNDYDATAPWVGNVDTAWYDNAEAGTVEFVIDTAAELAGLAEIVNSGKDTFEGKTITLDADLDLNDKPWTPIGARSGNSVKFNGTFNGAGHTISNLRAVGSKGVGLFGTTWTSAHIENVNIVNAYVSGNDYVGAVVGGGYLSKNCIKNCTVENATIIATPYQLDNGEYDGGAKAGVIAGQIYNGHIMGNTAKNSTVTAYRDLGGIVGMLAIDGGAGVNATGNTVENVTLSYVGVAGTYKDKTANENMAEVVGRQGKSVTVDGNTVTNVTMNEANKGVTAIYTVDELIAFAKDVNNGNTYAGKTVILGADIDLSNREWTPIGNSTNKFQGTFDGNNKVISNLKITGNKSNVGLFGFTTNGEIKNLTVENALVTGYLNVGVVAGTPYTSKYTNVTVTGHVEVNGFAYVGGVGGKNAYANWTNVTVDVDETSYVNANSIENGSSYRTYVGGVVGFMGEGGHTFTNVTSNIDVIGTTCDIGGITGIAHYGNSFINCVSTGDVTLTTFDSKYPEDCDEIGGIAGVWHNQTGYTVTFKDCEFKGTLNIPAEATMVDLSNNTITGKAYKSSGTGELVIVNYYDLDGATYIKDGVTGEDTLYLVSADYAESTFTVAEGTEAIGGYAFAYNKNIDKIVLPSTVTTLNDRAFRDTTASTVVLNEGLENISYQAFRNASNVTSVEIPSTVKTISKEAFQNSGVTALTIPANVTTLEYGACRDMKVLETVTIEGNVDIPVYAFRACTNLKTVNILGDNVTFGNGSTGMIFTNKENGDGSAITVNVANEDIKDRLLAADTAAKDYGGYTINCANTKVEGKTYYEDETSGVAYGYDADALVGALEDGKDFCLMVDTKIDPAGMSNAYGTTGINVKAGQTIDGNGKTLDIKGAGGTWDSGISTTGGTIKNITVTGSFRGIFINHNSDHAEAVVLENVIIDGTVYTISCDQGSNQGLTATNCTFNGWTSYAATLGAAEFVDCNFGEGSGYAYCRPYAETTFEGCNFEAGFEMDARAKVTFVDCYYNGTLITAENVATLVTSNVANVTVSNTAN